MIRLSLKLLMVASATISLNTTSGENKLRFASPLSSVSIVNKEVTESESTLINDLSHLSFNSGTHNSCLFSSSDVRLFDKNKKHGGWCQDSENPLPNEKWNYIEFKSNIASDPMHALVALSNSNLSSMSGNYGTVVWGQLPFYFDGRTSKVVVESDEIFSGNQAALKDDVFGFLLNSDSGKFYMHKNGDWNYFNNTPELENSYLGIIEVGGPLYLTSVTATNTKNVDISFFLRSDNQQFTPSL
jgi:hypothetical protein